MIAQDSDNKAVFCPNSHQNPEGSEWCGICGLPVIDYGVELELLLRTLSDQERYVRFIKENIVLGIGDQGCKLAHSFYQSCGRDLKSTAFLLIESSGDAQQFVDTDDSRSPSFPKYPSLSLYRLPDSPSRHLGHYSLGEHLASNDIHLDDRLRRSGIRDSSRKQTIFLLAALGGGTGSGASPYILERAKALNHLCRSFAIAVMPAEDEPDSTHFNALCSLARFLGQNGGPIADMILLTDHDRLMKIRGIGRKGEELARESLISHMLALLIGAIADRGSGQTDPGYLAKLSRSMGICAFIPCIAAGCSLEIFGGITNILDSALLFSLAHVDNESVLLSFISAQVPYRLSSTIREEKLRAELNKWNKVHFPHLKESVIQISHSSMMSDRIDICLLLGGNKLAITAKRAKDGFHRFKSIVGSEVWEQEFPINSESVAEIEPAINSYDSRLDEMLA